MNEIEQLRADLQAIKGRWPAIAKAAMVSMSTLVRVANGRTRLPMYWNLNKLRAAVKHEAKK